MTDTKSIDRAKSTYNAPAIAHLISVVDKKMKTTLLPRLHDVFGQSENLYFDHGMKLDPTRYVSLLNNYETCHTYVSKLRDEIQNAGQQIFAGMVEGDIVAKSVELLSRAEKNVHIALKVSLPSLLLLILQDRVTAFAERAVLSDTYFFAALYATSFVVNEEEFSQYQVNDPYIQEMIHKMSDFILGPVRELMLPHLYSSAVSALAEVVFGTFERFLLHSERKLAFNQVCRCN